MKAAKTTLRALLLAAAAAAVMVALASCPNPVADLLNSDGWGLIGQWQSLNRTGSNPGNFYKLTVRADGSFTAVDSTASITIIGNYAVESLAVSGEVRTMKIHFTYSGSMHEYALARVTNGTTYESVVSGLLPYPSSISTGDPNYLIAELQ